MRTRYIFGAAFLFIAILSGIQIINFQHQAKKSERASISQITNDPINIQSVEFATQAALQLAENQPRAAAVKPQGHAVTHRHKFAPLYYPAVGAALSAAELRLPAVQTGYQRSADYFGNKSSSTQETERKHFTLPPDIGLQVGFAQSSFAHQYQSIPVNSFSVGAFYNIRLASRFAFQPGLTYLTRGNKLAYPNDNQITEKLRLHYLELPANFVYRTGKPGNVRLMVGAGPYAALLLNAKDKMNIPTGADIFPPARQYIASNANRWDYGIGGFFGIQSPDGLFLKVGGEYGLANVFNKTASSSGFNNYSVLVTIGFLTGARR